LGHPGYSGVTLALLHGTCPDALVLVHQVGRAQYKAPPHLGLPPIRDLIRAYEQTAGLLHPARVAAVALNSLGSPAEDARVAADRLEQELGLPVADPVRDGCDRLLSAPGVLG
jgi:uncharacterized NAD-dependent epimerase/dehydratase family protein